MVGGCAGAYLGGVMKEVLRPWREASTWWSLTHVLLDAAVGSIAFTVVITFAALSLALLITFPLALPCVWGLFVASRAMSAIERSRLENLLGERITDPVPPLVASRPWGRLVERIRSGDRWREIAYHVLALPRGVFTTVVAAVAWCGSAALLLLPLYVSHLPGGTAKFWLFEVGPGPAAWARPGGPRRPRGGRAVGHPGAGPPRRALRPLVLRAGPGASRRVRRNA